MTGKILMVVGLLVAGGALLARYVQAPQTEYSTDTVKPVVQREYAPGQLGTATFAGGCFWCTEAVFQEYAGVLDAVSGYAGGEEPNPSYDEVVAKKTGHRESIEIEYDKEMVDYETLLELLFKSIEPTDDGGQFGDRGFQYTTAIFYHDEEQKRIAEAFVKKEALNYDEPIATKILPYTTFYKAEAFHQDFYKNSKARYDRYKKGSGRTQYFEETGLNAMQKAAREESTGGDNVYNPISFKKPTDEELREKLTNIQYRVTQEDGTETPFFNKYWDNTENGIYVDVVSGEPLFSSRDKYKSGTGRPSFVKPINENMIVLKEDTKLFTPRVEVRSVNADSHLGHVFDDGPVDRGGKRYCMNSAAMEFVPLAEMEERGYGEYVSQVVD